MYFKRNNYPKINSQQNICLKTRPTNAKQICLKEFHLSRPSSHLFQANWHGPGGSLMHFSFFCELFLSLNPQLQLSCTHLRTRFS